jgi:hypothetical protein
LRRTAASSPSCYCRGGSGAIPATERAMWRGEVSRRLSEEWGVRWCEKFVMRMPLFIAGERGRGCGHGEW